MNGALTSRLANCERVHLDTVAFIYFFEANPKYVALLRPLFQSVTSGRLRAISSTLTLAEVLVRPLRESRQDLADKYRNVLTMAPGFALYPVDREIAEGGAKIRADYNVRLPDAIQLATAIHRGADAFVSNDRRLASFVGLEVVILDDLVSAPAS